MGATVLTTTAPQIENVEKGTTEYRERRRERMCCSELSCGERVGGDGEEAVRKGPRKAEEDEVLLSHVRRYGPRDWSSVRSKGLLRRTGKSCRLRWVNKLRPNLKKYVYPSFFFLSQRMQVLRVVIELLAAQFGKKWAKMDGRTENDVKNFWSCRQKRDARALGNASTLSKSPKHIKEDPTFHDVVSICKGPKLSTLSEGESPSKALLSSENHFLRSRRDGVQTRPNHVERKPCLDCPSHFPFPRIPQPPQDLLIASESQDLMAWLDNSYFFDVPGFIHYSELGNDLQLPIGPPVSVPDGSYHSTPRGEVDNSMTLDWFFDDFPANIFL